MARKIYDIFPPRTGKEPIPLKEKTANLSSRPLIFLTALLISAASVSIYFLILRVNIEIWPETVPVEYSGIVTIRSDQYHHDVESSTVPGKIFTLKLEESRSFPATGKEKDDKRAEGILRVYNDYSESPQTLIAETRFVSADGKLFRSIESVTVPGRSGSTPGSIDIKVRAAEAGEGYNIEKTSKFSIPGLQGTPMYMNIYAENPNPITGGSIGESMVITASDIELAKETLFNSVSESAKEQLRTANPEYLFEDEMTKVNLVTEFVGPEEGEKFDSFDYSVEVEVKSFGFKESELKDFIKETLLFGFEDGMEIWDDSLSISYESDSQIIAEGVVAVEISASALAYPPIREDLIKSEIAKKKMDEVNRLLGDYQKIERFKIEPRPSWLKKMPGSDKINIKISFD